jgi:sugar phosphate isomerase/epimerase
LQFGISTHLYHNTTLSRDHLVEIAAHGFEAVELFANRPHFDYTDARSVDLLEEGLHDTGLHLHAVHAPIAEDLTGGRWRAPLSIASADERARQHARQEVEAALSIARRVPFPFLVVHVGVPDAQNPAATDNRGDMALRTVEALQAAADPLGVRLALEVMPNRLSRPDTLVSMLEDDLETARTGLCLDFGHAFLMGDLMEAVETVAGHMITTHVHDNLGAHDDHLVPFEGRINWDATMMAVQKIGYDGVFVFELAASAEPRQVLERARQARERFERMLTF